MYDADGMKAALNYGRTEVVRLLLEACAPSEGAAITRAAQVCFKWYTPDQWDTMLQAATQHGHTEFTGMLRELRAAAAASSNSMLTAINIRTFLL
jgi:hypothetical protein